MRILAALLLTSSPALACDWKIHLEQVDPMTDERVCLIASQSAALNLTVWPDRIRLGSPSRLKYDNLVIRVDDLDPVYLPDDGRSTASDDDSARVVMDQLTIGHRVRTRSRGVTGLTEGDAPICNLPELVRSCQP